MDTRYILRRTATGLPPLCILRSVFPPSCGFITVCACADNRDSCSLSFAGRNRAGAGLQCRCTQGSPSPGPPSDDGVGFHTYSYLYTLDGCGCQVQFYCCGQRLLWVRPSRQFCQITFMLQLVQLRWCPEGRPDQEDSSCCRFARPRMRVPGRCVPGVRSQAIRPKRRTVCWVTGQEQGSGPSCMSGGSEKSRERTGCRAGNGSLDANPNRPFLRMLSDDRESSMPAHAGSDTRWR